MNTAVLTEEVLEVLEESEVGYCDGDFFLIEYPNSVSLGIDVDRIIKGVTISLLVEPYQSIAEATERVVYNETVTTLKDTIDYTTQQKS